MRIPIRMRALAVSFAALAVPHLASAQCTNCDWSVQQDHYVCIGAETGSRECWTEREEEFWVCITVGTCGRQSFLPDGTPAIPAPFLFAMAQPAGLAGLYTLNPAFQLIPTADGEALVVKSCDGTVLFRSNPLRTAQSLQAEFADFSL